MEGLGSDGTRKGRDMSPTASVAQRTAGVFKSHKAPLSATELREAAERAVAQDAVERTAEP